MFDFEIDRGMLGIGGTVFSRGGVVRFALDLCAYDSESLGWEQRGAGAFARRDDLEFSLRIDDRGIAAAVKNVGQAACRLLDVTMQFRADDLPDPPRAEDYMEYIHAMNFETLSGVKRVGLPNRWLAADPTSSMAYVLHHRGAGQACLFSTLPPHAGDYVTFRALHDSPHLEGYFGLEVKCVLDRQIGPGQSVSTSTIQCRCGDDPMALLAGLGAQWQDGLNLTVKPSRLGWNSWDFFASAISSADVIENTRAARDLFGIAKPDIVLDGGWEQRWGVWQPNSLFPEGLDGLTVNIIREGGVPGIWIAPTAVNVYTRIYRDHPDWFIRDHAGKIIEQSYGYGPCGQLDVTHPQVQQWIRELFTRLRKDGFDLFKIDFAQHVIQAGTYHDRTVPRGAVLRRLFEIIRETIGADTYLIACGTPIESVTGLVDAIRTSGDIHNHWSHVLMNVTGISARWWMQGRLWNNDPDFLIVRTPTNCPNVPLNRPRNPRPFSYGQMWLSGREFDDREAQTYAFLVLLAGGDIMMGDHLPALREQGRDIIRRLIEHRLTKPATPMDLFDSHEGLPSLWLADEPEHWLVGVFNWEEDPRQVSVDLNKLGIHKAKEIRSFWDDRAIEAKDGIVQLSLDPRACLGLRIGK